MLNPKISKRCSKENCIFYDKLNKVSGCSKFNDRRKCSVSIKQRKKVADHSRKRGNTQNLY